MRARAIRTGVGTLELGLGVVDIDLVDGPTRKQALRTLEIAFGLLEHAARLSVRSPRFIEALQVVGLAQRGQGLALTYGIAFLQRARLAVETGKHSQRFDITADLKCQLHPARGLDVRRVARTGGARRTGDRRYLDCGGYWLDCECFVTTER
jgi:hypothetical protein